MPIYGYACRNCAHTVDVLQKISDPPLEDCPACGLPQLKRQLSAPRFRLKGGGWYETDFKKDNQRNLAGDTEPSKKDDKPADKPADKSADKTGGSGDTKSTASKPADTAG